MISLFNRTVRTIGFAVVDQTCCRWPSLLCRGSCWVFQKNSILPHTLSFFPLPSPHGQKEAPVEGRVKFLPSTSSPVDILMMEIMKISLWLTKTDVNIIFRRMSFPWSIAGMASRFYPEGCPGSLWTPVFGRNAGKIYLISYNFMGKHAFWTASFQCLAKSLYCVHLIKMRICNWLHFQCTSASRNCQHWFIVHWVGRGWGGTWLYFYIVVAFSYLNCLHCRPSRLSTSPWVTISCLQIHAKEKNHNEYNYHTAA